jgi:predicted transcriptional regulator
MATTNATTKCSTCNKEGRTYLCQGCSANFCLNCLTKHHQTHIVELDGIGNNHNNLRKRLDDQKEDPKKRPLIQQINRWENDSVNKIRQAAEEFRKTLKEYTDKSIPEIEKKLNDIAEQIRKTREDDQFNEIDLDELKEKLQKLAKEFDQPSNISIEQESAPFINKISLVLSKYNTSI